MSNAPVIFLFFSTISLGVIASEVQGKDIAAKIEFTKKESSIFDDIWRLATLYKDERNPVLQEFKLRGRYNGQYHWLDSDQGNTHDWENRRSRFGFDARLFQQVELRLDAQSSAEFDPFYAGLVDAYIKWSPSENFHITVGKQMPKIAAFDWLSPLITQQTFERSQMFNQLKIDRVPGLVVEGKSGNVSYQAGVYSNDVDNELGGFDGGYSFGGGIGYDLKSSMGLEKAEWRLDYLHSDAEECDELFSTYDNIFTTTLSLKDGRWGLGAEVFLASGNSPDAFGFLIQPSWDIVRKKLQIVARYSLSTGDGPDSVLAQRRYERSAPNLSGGGKGDFYNAAYLGLQYFIYGDRLKLLAGAEYAHLNGGGNGGSYDGVTYLAGVRLGF